ncbi:hypothetical protein C8R43DRAFT_1238125 [Mycena crocata]|nr:hypothetical protein C8R43DRAFT_1238125 [Mycena crocata]
MSVMIPGDFPRRNHHIRLAVRRQCTSSDRRRRYLWLCLQVVPLIHMGDMSDVGRRTGTLFSILSLSALAGPPISGAIASATGDYKAVGYYAGSVIMVGVVILCMSVLRPFKALDMFKFNNMSRHRPRLSCDTPSHDAALALSAPPMCRPPASPSAPRTSLSAHWCGAFVRPLTQTRTLLHASPARSLLPLIISMSFLH